MRLVERIASVPFRRFVWLLPVTYTLHELEEWNILLWYQAQFGQVPTDSDLVVHTWLIGISLVGFVWTMIACLLPTPRATAIFVLPFFVVLVFGNALQHVYWQVAFGAYAPGVLAAALLNVPAILLLSWHALRNRLVQWPFLGILYALSIPSLVSAARAGRDTLPFRAIYDLSERVARILFGAA
jgi:hypothetical protein